MTTSSQAAESRALILGDSLSAAYNIAIEESWPHLFARRLADNNHPVAVINASISGETTVGGVQRLPALLDKHQPRYLILELGGNDGLRGHSFKQTRDNLQQMIEQALDRDIRVLLIGVRLPPNLGPVYNRRFQQTYQQLAQSNQVAYLARFLEGVAANRPEYMQDDGIHPTAIAQPILADKVYVKFTEMLATGS